MPFFPIFTTDVYESKIKRESLIYKDDIIKGIFLIELFVRDQTKRLEIIESIVDDRTKRISMVIAWKIYMSLISSYQKRYKNNLKQSKVFNGKTINDAALSDLYKLRRIIGRLSEKGE